MPEPFSVEVDDHGTTVYLRGMESRARDLLPLHRIIGELAYADVMENFETETDPYGVPWRENSPWVLREKRRLGRIMKVLQSTGVMKSRTNYQATRSGVTIGNYDQKAYKHQLGIGVPQREIIGVGDELLEDMRYASYDYITEGDTNAR